MDIIRPVTVDNTILVSSNVTEDDYAEWASGTTYADGDRVIVIGDTHKVYESLVNSNTGNDPTTDDGSNWLELGATNRWKAFDQKISDQVENTDSIEYTFNDTSSYVTSLVMFGLEATSANVTVTDNAVGGEGEVYNTTVSLIDNRDVDDWYTYFFEQIIYKREAQFFNIPPFLNADVEVTISGDTGSTVKVGQIVFGFLVDLGLTTYGTTISIEDFSRKETDAFGNFVVVERPFANLVDYDVRFPTGTARKVQQTLAQYRATPIVYIGSESTQFGTTAYGFYRRFDLTLETPSYSLAAIEVEGLT